MSEETNTTCACGTGEKKKLLDSVGLQYIFDKLSGKICLAVGTIDAKGEYPLTLEREYTDGGILITGNVALATTGNDGLMSADNMVIFKKVCSVVKGIAEDYVTQEDMKETAAELQEAIDNIKLLVIPSDGKLPTENIEANKIYLIPAENGEDGNIFSEYVYNEETGAWELIGTKEITFDIENYVTLDALAEKLKDYTKTSGLKDAIGEATQSASGLMSAEDKAKLDDLVERYNNGEFTCKCSGSDTSTTDDSYNAPSVEFSYGTRSSYTLVGNNTLSVNGGTASPKITVSQTRTTDEGTAAVTPDPSYVFLFIKDSTVESEVTIDSSTGTITYEAYSGERGDGKVFLGTVVCLCTSYGKTGYATAEVYQYQDTQTVSVSDSIASNISKMISGSNANLVTTDCHTGDNYNTQAAGQYATYGEAITVPANAEVTIAVGAHTIYFSPGSAGKDMGWTDDNGNEAYNDGSGTSSASILLGYVWTSASGKPTEIIDTAMSVTGTTLETNKGTPFSVAAKTITISSAPAERTLYLCVWPHDYFLFYQACVSVEGLTVTVSYEN